MFGAAWSSKTSSHRNSDLPLLLTDRWRGMGLHLSGTTVRPHLTITNGGANGARCHSSARLSLGGHHISPGARLCPCTGANSHDVDGCLSSPGSWCRLRNQPHHPWPVRPRE